MRGFAVGLAALAALGAGCVSTATHEQAVSELNQRLAAERESADAERERLYTENDTLRAERDEARQRLEQQQRELGPKARGYDELQPTYEGLVRDLEADLAAARIQIDRLREGLRTRLPAATLFASGSAELTPEGEQVLARLGAQLADLDYQVRVEGHTDDVAIRGALAARYPTNWDLAAARAVRVVRALAAAGVPPERLAAVSLGEFHPLVPGDSPEARAENRRIEIRLVPRPGTRPDARVPEGFAAPEPEGPATPVPGSSAEPGRERPGPPAAPDPPDTAPGAPPAP
ncbi:MAG: OmpA family protein [Deltaproteobacteria bacterium]|nr:OmpA family protein [Deltaproteobacteria bacterium]